MCYHPSPRHKKHVDNNTKCENVIIDKCLLFNMFNTKREKREH
jgi:hypothetical protein